MSGDGADGAAEAPRDGDERPDLDIDRAFAEIVAAWSSSPEGAAPDEPSDAPRRPVPWPESEDLPAPGEPTRPPESASAQGATAEDVTPSWVQRSREDIEAEVDALVDADGFVPPDPTPLPHGDLTTRLSWVGVIGGPLFLVFAALFWNDLPQWLLLTAVVAFVGGFATLVARMPSDRDEDDDDGAVV